MSDCTSIEMRELLPELMHGRLGAASRARVERHLADCAECAAELSTLMAVRTAMAHTPVIDVAAIVRALPRPPATVHPGTPTLRVERGGAPGARAETRSVRAPRAWRSVIWQIAAALALVSAGGMSLAVARSYFDGGITDSTGNELTVDSVRQADSTTSIARTPPVRTAETPSAPSLTLGGGVGDLDIAELESLLGALESLEAAPSADPESVNDAASVGTGRGEGGLD